MLKCGYFRMDIISSDTSRQVDFTKIIVVYSHPRFHRIPKSCRSFNFNGFSVLSLLLCPNAKHRSQPAAQRVATRRTLYWHDTRRVVSPAEWQLCNLWRSRCAYTRITILLIIILYTRILQPDRRHGPYEKSTATTVVYGRNRSKKPQKKITLRRSRQTAAICRYLNHHPYRKHFNTNYNYNVAEIGGVPLNHQALAVAHT